jgi:hypothetical protein
MNKEFLNILDKNQERFNIYPVSYVTTGSNIYGLSNKTNQEYAGIHLMSTANYLQHPDFRLEQEILRISLDKNHNLIKENNKNKVSGVTSFEIWKFLSLYMSGSIVTYDMLYMSPVFTDPEFEEIMNLLRSGISNKIGMSAKTYVMNNWQKDRTDQRKINMSFYRLLQAIIFLRQEEYIVDIESLWSEYSQFDKYENGKKVFLKFKNTNYSKSKLSLKEITGTAKELEQLIDEVNKASIATRLPDAISKNNLTIAMDAVVKKRISLI